MIPARFLLVLLFSHGLVGAEEKTTRPPLLSDEELQAAGILVWEYSLPTDLKPGEFAMLRWRISDPAFKDGQLESGLDFKGIPTGTDFKIVLWTGEFFLKDEAGAPAEATGMRFCITHRKPDGKLTSRYGIMKHPKGWNDFYSYMPSQKSANLDEGYLLMLYNPEREGTNAALAILDLVYEFEDTPKKSE
jgi:hypothetical protein